MSDSLIPERPLLVSPSLAASIGLEQALLLQHLQERINLFPVDLDGKDSHYIWSRCSVQHLVEQLPFWDAAVVRRLLQDLDQMDIVLVREFPQNADSPFLFAINEHRPGSAASSPTAASTKTRSSRSQALSSSHQSMGAYRIPEDWKPSQDLLQKLRELSIDSGFVQQAVPEFVMYWRERNEVAHAWSSKFMSYISRRWEQEKQHRAQREHKQTANHNQAISGNWQPSEDALEVLAQMGIHDNFIEDAIPEFVLYWNENGSEQKTWNSKFVSHVKRQWASYTHTLKHDTKPRLIDENWQPDDEVFDILNLANIDGEFAQSLIPEFVMYWRDRNELHHSWNTRFLQYVKRQWSYNHLVKEKHDENHRQQPEKRKTRDRSLVEDLTDRSWAG